MITLTDYNDFFLFIVGLLITLGVIYVFFRRTFRNIFISEDEVSKLRISKQESTPKISFPANSKNIDSQALIKKVSMILIAIIIGGFLLNQFLMWRMNSSGILSKLFNINITFTKK